MNKEKFYLIGRDEHYAQVCSEQCMLKIAQKEYERIYEMNKIALEEELDEDFIDRCLKPEPTDRTTAIMFLIRHGLYQRSVYLYEDIDDEMWQWIKL